MLRFKCELIEKYQSSICWEGTVEVVSRCEKVIVATVVSEDNTYRIIMGDYGTGHFLCIPSEDVGIDVEDFTEWGAVCLELADLIKVKDVVTIARAVSLIALMPEETL